MALKNSVEIFLIANVDKWVKGIDKATGKVDELGRALKRQRDISKTMTNVGLGMIAAASGVVMATVGPAMKLEDSIARIASQTNLTGQEFNTFTKRLSADAKRMAVEVGASLDQVSAAFDTAVREGVDPASDEFNRFVKQALQLASVTGTDVNFSIGMLDETLDRFGKRLSDVPDAMDIMYRASRAGTLGFDSFSQSMSAAAMQAGGLQVPFGEMAAMIALMGDRGLAGTRAGMALGNVLNRLATATGPAAETLRKLGVEVIDPTTGKIRNLADLFTNLRDALVRLPKAEQLQVLAQLGGEQALGRLSGILTDATVDFRAFFAEVDRGKGISEAFADRAGTAQQRMRELKASIEVARTEIGVAFLPVLEEMAGGLAGALQKVTPFIQANADLIAPLTGVTFAAGGLSLALGQLVKMKAALLRLIPALAGSFGPLGIALAAVAGALTLVVISSRSVEDKIANLERSMADKEARASTLKDRIAELEKVEKTWIETTGKAPPELMAARRELANLTKEIETHKKKLDELQGGPLPETIFGIDAALGTLREQRDQLAQEIEDRRKVDVQARKNTWGVDQRIADDLDKIEFQINRLMARRAELARVSTEATDKEAGGLGEVSGEAARYAAEIERLRQEIERLRAEMHAVPELPIEDKALPAVEPIRGPGVDVTFGGEFIEQGEIAQSALYKLTESAGFTATAIDMAFADLWEHQAFYITEFTDIFTSAFSQMVTSGQNVLKSFGKAFAVAMIGTVRSAIQAAIAQIMVTILTEKGKALIMSPLSLGGTLAAIPAILAAGAASIAGLTALEAKITKGMYTGGIVRKTEKLIVHEGERVVNPYYNSPGDLARMFSGTPLAPAVAGAGGALAGTRVPQMPIRITNYGPVSSELDVEAIIRRVADEVRRSITQGG